MPSSESEDEDFYFNQYEETKKKELEEKLKNKEKLPPSQYACIKCGLNDVDFKSNSKRRPDEPPVDEFTCKSCGKKWEVRG